MKASDLFVRALEAEGVEYIFGVPGEENLDLLESLRHSPIRMVVTRHEQAAGFMAATLGRLTGKPGVCLSTLGPGATNLVTAAAYAQLGAMPMLMLTGQKPIRSSKQGAFQIIDVVDMMRPITKYTRQIVAAAGIPAKVREAFRRAAEERPGATHLELPEDIAREDCDALLLPASHSRRPVADQKAIVMARRALEKAKHPLLLIGAGANRKTSSRMLQRFVDTLGVPFCATQMGKGVVDENHPLWLGCAALSDGDYVHRAIAAADLILMVGHDVVEKPPFFMREGRRTVIHINYVSAEVDSVYFPQIELVGDIANTMWRLQNELEPSPHWDFSFFDRVRQALCDQVREGGDDPRFPMLPQRVVADIRRCMGEQDFVCLDNGIYKLWFARNYRAARPNTLLLDNALATMGAGLPSAMAAALLHPERKVLAVCGDGGFMMNSQELETCVRLGLNLTVLVLRDDALGMIRWKQEEMGFGDYAMTLGNPDFVKYAESYGAHGHRPGSADAFAPLLARCLAEDGVHLIDLPVDYSQNVRILNHELRERADAL
ncbi:acetolactate synthase large subunit [Pseudoxanthomonas wuyuanensis]|uniref:Acetolactate synthase, large subunit n=1 Tax=Pseudoxanthomonas wuyuanensis TaxID=1073196 RepID=A0A286CVL6_9GAMM|nr:acetolactate synthase large subunit [Pseudoxanthomonas wuyuanensis]KAF1721294.1 acetolactate synthase large subunit [Pseudoxanthomonas wuyuanensis]SOD50458.1 acetolactate synthase, large subunit [Pseudoxanthomonas wuyuanensis]